MSAPILKRFLVAPWWLILLQGVLSIFIGGIILAAPGAAMFVFVRILGWYWLIKGIFSLTAIFHPDTKSHRAWLVVNSVLGILAGLVVLDLPLFSALFVPALVLTLIGVAGMMIGMNDLIAAFRGAGWPVALLGALSIFLGAVVLANAQVGVTVLPILLGCAQLAGGLVAIVAAFKVRAAQSAAVA